ncbi:MAG: Asp-tRNA(Asn)/Glu-tRNA(Gln) amidotransferase subunit GatC [SAR86 cluster bacterium]|jgi:aspartyl-tRNA(Asn)/glutamyl-tRNA(Gln) amidotransferase subunit C|nr:Asp-tRNA(Asn)/Glu-tRNA(Gln) amidotransferase subunit GatC [SAR86 cluster bacterium]
MSIKDKDLEEIAHLARIGINPSLFPELKKDLENILNLVEEMNKVDTGKIDPMSHPLDISQPLRKDEVSEENERDKLQKNAPLTKSGLFLVPQVIDATE